MKKGKRYLLLSIFIMVLTFNPPGTASATELAPESVSESSLDVKPAPESVSESSLDAEPAPESPTEEGQPVAEPAFVMQQPPEFVETPEPDEEPDGISSAAELFSWLESHKYSGGRAALTGDITMDEPCTFVPYPNMPPLSVETGEHTIFVCADTELLSDGRLTFEGEGGGQGIFHVERNGTLLLDGVNVEAVSADGGSQYALWQEEGAGMILGNTFAPCRVSGDIRYARKPLVLDAEHVCVVVEKGELLDDRLPTEVTCRVNAQGAILEHEPVAVTWDMEGTEKQQAERLRFQAQGVLQQTTDGVKPVCTVVYNDFPLTFTKAEAFVRSNAYTFRGEYTRQGGALAAVTLPEYSFDGENWIREGENNIFRADDGYYMAFPCDQWDVSANPYIYIRLRGETEEQVYYSNVLRYAANNMNIAEDLGGSRGGGTSIVNPPEEPEKPGESGKPEESERPGESGKPEESERPGESEKPEESERPGESEKPEEPEKSCESQNSAEPRKLPKQENANEPDAPEKTSEPAETEHSQTSAETFGWSNPKDGGAPDFAAQAKPELLPQTESGNMAAGQPGNYGLIVGIVLLSAVVGAVCFSVSKGTKR